MALRRSDLAKLGGFESVQDLLAEDFVLGRRVAELGKRVELAPEPVLNVSRQASVSAFLARYGRWSVMQRRTAGLGLHLAQGLLTPVTWAALAVAAAPRRQAALALLGVAVARALLELSARALLTGERPWRDLPLSPLKELLVSACWLRGLLTDRINWRGNLLRVRSGSVLEPIEGWAPRPAPTEVPVSRGDSPRSGAGR
jgi:ceramide glucosyltransferase